MRITHLTLTYPPVVGGADLYCEEIAAGMAERGHEVSVLASDLLEHVRFVRLPADVPRREIRRGVSVERHRAFNVPGRIYPVMPGFISALNRLRPDVIHAHCWSYYPVDLAALRHRTHGTPVVIKPWFPLRKERPPFLRRRADELSAQVSAVIAASSFEADAITAAGLSPRRIEIIPPGIDPAPFQAARTDRFDEIGWSGNPVILFVGRLAGGKGVDTLVDAMGRLASRHPRLRAALVGPDYGAKTPALEQAKKLGIADRLRFFEPPPDLPAFYRSSTVFCLPTRYEAFGIVLIEAMAAGLPIVSTRVGAVPTVVDDGRTGLLVEKDAPAALAAALDRVLAEPGLAPRLAAAASVEVERKYRRDVTLDALEKLYRDVA